MLENKADLKLCKDCDHFVTVQRHGPYKTIPCTSCNIGLDVIKGGIVDVKFLRGDEKLCGRAGKFWRRTPFIHYRKYFLEFIDKSNERFLMQGVVKSTWNSTETSIPAKDTLCVVRSDKGAIALAYYRGPGEGWVYADVLNPLKFKPYYWKEYLGLTNND